MTKLADNDTLIYQAMRHKNVEFIKFAVKPRAFRPRI